MAVAGSSAISVAAGTAVSESIATTHTRPKPTAAPRGEWPIPISTLLPVSWSIRRTVCWNSFGTQT